MNVPMGIITKNSVLGYIKVRPEHSLECWRQKGYERPHDELLLLLRDGSFASICLYIPTPESSEGAGDAMGLFTAGVLVEGLVAAEVLRTRLVVPIVWGIGERVLMSHAGRVIVALA